MQILILLLKKFSCASVDDKTSIISRCTTRLWKLCKSMFNILENKIEYQTYCFHYLENIKDRIFDNYFTIVHDWRQEADQIKYGPLLSWTFELGRCNKTYAFKWWWWWWWWWWWRRPPRRSYDIFCCTAKLVQWSELQLN